MPATDNETSKFLIDLIINQDQVTQKWIEFLIAIQAGLVVVLGFLIRPTTPTQLGQVSPPHATLYVISAIGIFIAAAIAWIVHRERKWTGWYVNRFNKLPDLTDKVFPSQANNKQYESASQEFQAQPAGRTSQIITGLAILLCSGWFAVILWARFSM
jgi:hypothetical protein